MNKLSKTEAMKTIEAFFQRSSFQPLEVRKMKRLAMQHKIRLGKHRARFCKKCYNDLSKSKKRVTKTHVIKTCLQCEFVNKSRLGSHNKSI